MTTNLEKHRLDTLQVLRAVAALVVLAAHDAHYFAPKREYLVFANGFFEWGWVGVDLFFCISGFIMAWVHGQDLRLSRGARAFALKRFLRIYPPYVVLLIITLLLGAAASLAGREPWRDPAAIWQSFLLLPPYKNLVVGVAWTLTHETLFYVLFCAAIVLGPRLASWLAGLWLVGILTFPHPAAGTISPFCDFLFNPFNLEFLAGVATAYAVRAFRAPSASWFLLVTCFALLVVGFVFGWWQNFMSYHTAPNIPKKAAIAALCCGIIFAVVRIELNHELKVPRLLVLIGTASYSIYLVHANLMRWIGYAVMSHFSRSFDSPYFVEAFLVATALAGLAGGLAYYFLVERPLLRASRNWLKRHLDAGPPREGTPSSSSSCPPV